MSITATAALARAVEALRDLAEFTDTTFSEHNSGSSQREIYDALGVILADVAVIPGAGACVPEDLVPFLRGIPAQADESRTWIRKLRESIETIKVQSDIAVADPARVDDILAGFDRLLADAALAEERTAERIATFLEKCAAMHRRYLVAAESPKALITVAHDVRNGAWRKP